MNLSFRLRPATALLFAALGCSNSSSPGATTPDASSPDSQAVQDSATPDSATPDSAISDSAISDSAATDAGIGSDSSALSFSTDIYTPIIGEHCVFCHGPTADGGQGGGEAFGKLDMSTVDAAYGNLVNVAAQGIDCAMIDGAPTPIRVVPGDPSTSLLYLKVNGYTVAPPCGAAMPKAEIPDGGQAVVAQQIQTWIAEGAQP